MSDRVTGDLMDAARGRADGMATLHVLALAAVVVLAVTHVLDGPAVMAGLGMILHGFREAHRNARTPPPSDPDGQAPGERSTVPPPPAPSPKPRVPRRGFLGAALDGAELGARRLSWAAVVLLAVSLASCATTQPPNNSAPDIVLKTRAVIRSVCAAAVRAADEAVKLFDDTPVPTPRSSGGESTAGDASAATDAGAQVDAALDGAEVLP